jgi:hypothetical protein
MSEERKETWLQWVALTTTILAVAAAISSLRASSYSTQVQIGATKEANQWAYFQSKGIKEHGFQLNRDTLAAARLLGKNNTEIGAFLSAKIKEYDGEIARYDQEKREIKLEAEKLQRGQATLKQHNVNYSMAVMLLQIAIMLSAVGALLKKKFPWFAGIAIGLVGLVYMVNGFFLFF